MGAGEFNHQQSMCIVLFNLKLVPCNQKACNNDNNENQEEELRETNVGAIRSAGLPIVWVLGYHNEEFENKS